MLLALPHTVELHFLVHVQPDVIPAKAARLKVHPVEEERGDLQLASQLFLELWCSAQERFGSRESLWCQIVNEAALSMTHMTRTRAAWASYSEVSRLLAHSLLRLHVAVRPMLSLETGLNLWQ